MLINNQGVAIRINVSDISVTSRSAMGVKLMRTLEDEAVVTIAKISGDTNEEEYTNIIVEEVATEVKDEEN